MTATKFKNKLLKRAEVVKVEVFVHDIQVLTDVRQALAMGLTPNGFEVTDDSVVLALERIRTTQPIGTTGLANPCVGSRSMRNG